MKEKYISLVAFAAAICLLCGCSRITGGLTAGKSDPVALVSDVATTQYFTDEAVDDADLETILTAGINAPSAMNGQPWHFTVITDAAVLEQISGDMGGGMPPAGQLPEGMEFSPDMEKPEAADRPEIPDGMPAEGFTPPEGFEAGEQPEGFTPPEGSEAGELPEGFTPPEGGFEGKTPPAGFGGGAPGGMTKAGLTDAPVAIVISCKAGSELDAGLACQNMSVAAQLLGYGTKIISSPTMALNGEKQAEYRTLLGIPEDQAAAAILLIGKADTSVDETVDGYTGATARNPIDELVTFIDPS